MVVWEGNEIIHVGPWFSGEVDEIIDATGKIVTPGLINTHAHLAGSPLDKSFIEDRGSRQFYLSGLFEYLPVHLALRMKQGIVPVLPSRWQSSCALERPQFAKSDIAHQRPSQRLARSDCAGTRLGHRSGRWYTDNGREAKWSWDEAAGKTGLARAIKFIEENDGSQNGRIKGFLSPMQIDTCTEDLLRESKAAADAMGVPIALHAGPIRH